MFEKALVPRNIAESIGQSPFGGGCLCLDWRRECDGNVKHRDGILCQASVVGGKLYLLVEGATIFLVSFIQVERLKLSVWEIVALVHCMTEI